MNTSNSAAMNRIKTAISIRSEESRSIFSNLLVLYSLFIIATESIPPAIPATKYAAISGMPCREYLNTLNEVP